ncbi:BgTH12-07614 [Blumeria graminis f. sp. triticale]|uniref:BgTH12-07614 n=1 Tax=Blumeria graminis f. sp. triticale TaxID=1689686 RepID=A0A9W4GCF1_BLUGR|nr:BgTH12-07614 [Blumeria graminis f. sp. triticale]
MKFLHLTGIIVLLSQAASISAATLVPRMESDSEPFDSLYPEIIAAIDKTLREKTSPLKSPNDYVKRLARKFRVPFLIPVQVSAEWHNEKYESYIANDRMDKLNLWVVVENGECIITKLVDRYVAQPGA